MDTLTPRQERFCHSFVNSLNAAKAARDAGYAPRTAKHQGWRLLNRPEILARIQTIQRDLADEFGRDTGTLIGKLETVYRRAMGDRRYHAAAHAVALQARLGYAEGPPYKHWKTLAIAAIRYSEDAKAAAAKMAAKTGEPWTDASVVPAATAGPAADGDASAPERSQSSAVSAPSPAPAQTGLRAVGG